MIDINEALTAYLGTDARGGYMPLNHEKRLQEQYGESWQQALDAIDIYLQFDYGPDWSKHDLISAGEEFAQSVLAQFPNLAPNVARALGNRFTYSWK